LNACPCSKNTARLQPWKEDEEAEDEEHDNDEVAKKGTVEAVSTTENLSLSLSLYIYIFRKALACPDSGGAWLKPSAGVRGGGSPREGDRQPRCAPSRGCPRVHFEVTLASFGDPWSSRVMFFGV